MDCVEWNAISDRFDMSSGNESHTKDPIESQENLSPWQKFGKFNLAYLVPINTVIGLLTTISAVLDFVSPKWPVLPALAWASSIVFLFVLALFKLGYFTLLAEVRIFQRVVQPIHGPLIKIPLFVFSAITACLFSIAAIASTKHAGDGGFIAGKFDAIKALQARMGLVEEKLDELDAKQDTMLGKQDEVIKQIEVMSKKLDSISNKDRKAVVRDPSHPRLDTSSASTMNSAGKPVWAIGHEWVYAYSLTLQGESVRSSFTKTVSQASSKAMILKSSDGETSTFQELDADFKIRHEYDQKYNGARYEKNYSAMPYLLNFPLYPGKEWKERYVETTNAIPPVPRAEYSVQSQVRNWETIQVEAGTFRAIRIDTLKTDLASGLKINISSWYSPEVGQIIKMHSSQLEQGLQLRSREELISFYR